MVGGTQLRFSTPLALRQGDSAAQRKLAMSGDIFGYQDREQSATGISGWGLGAAKHPALHRTHHHPHRQRISRPGMSIVCRLRRAGLPSE